MSGWAMSRFDEVLIGLWWWMSKEWDVFRCRHYPQIMHKEAQ